jgi:hypothetical protein
MMVLRLQLLIAHDLPNVQFSMKSGFFVPILSMSFQDPMTVAGSLCVADGYPVRFQGHEIVAFRGVATSSKEVHLDRPWWKSVSKRGLDGTFGVG